MGANGPRLNVTHTVPSLWSLYIRFSATRNASHSSSTICARGRCGGEAIMRLREEMCGCFSCSGETEREGEGSSWAGSYIYLQNYSSRRGAVGGHRAVGRRSRETAAVLPSETAVG